MSGIANLSKKKEIGTLNPYEPTTTILLTVVSK